jgi:hypothetical protein
MRLNRLLSRATLALLLTTGIAKAATGQSIVTGAIAGTLTDASQKAIPAVHVVARNIETNRESSATTDRDGRFRIVDLPPGQYVVDVDWPPLGHLDVANVVVEAGRTTTAHASLRSDPGGHGLARSGSSAVNTTGQHQSAHLTQTTFTDLPNNGRRWSNFAILAPATALEGTSGSVSFRGITSLLNTNTIDGGNNNQALSSTERGGRRIGYAIGLASIREVDISFSNYPSSYAGTGGGVINAVTKSGTNTFHASGFFYDRDNTWGARNPRGFQNVVIDGAPALVPLKPVDTRPAAAHRPSNFDAQRSGVLQQRRSRNRRHRAQGAQPRADGCTDRFHAEVSRGPDR